MDAPKLLPPRGWWLILLGILVCAGALRFTGYNFSLPYIDHVDEASYTLAGRMMIDSGSAKPIGMQGYPPGIITVNYFFLRQFHDPSTPPTSIIWMVRLVSVGFSLLTIVAIGLLAFRLATPLAGLFAAGLWTFTPIIVEFSRFATADNFVTFFTVFAFFLALTGTRFNRRHWIYAAMASQALAILFKYQAVFVLPVLVLVPLWRLADSSVPRRAVLREFAIALGFWGVFFFWLIFLFPALEATSAPDWSAPNERLGIPAPDVIWSNFRGFYVQLESDLYWLVGWVGLGALAWRSFRRRVDLYALLVVAAAALAWVIGISFYGNLGIQQFRQYIASGAFLFALRALGLVGWVFMIEWLLQRTPGVPQRRTLAAVVVSAVVIVLGIPAIQASIANAENHTLPDRRNDLAHWMDISVPSGHYIAGTENHKTFNRDWGGYAGITRFPFVGVAHLADKSIEEWRADDVQYAIIGNYEYQDWLASDAGRTQQAQTLLLKTYPPSPDYRGPDMVVLRLSPMQRDADGQLGTIHWIGYDLNTTEAAPGDSLEFSLYWQAERPTNAEYVVFNHLVDPQTGDTVAQVDGDPLTDLRRPTTQWDDPAEVLISRTFVLPLTDVPPGTYQLVTGFYRRDTGERLLSVQNEDSLTIATIEVR